MWNPWPHIRIIGTLLIFAGYFLHRLELTFIGLLVQYVGVVGTVDRLVARFDALIEKKEE